MKKIAFLFIIGIGFNLLCCSMFPRFSYAADYRLEVGCVPIPPYYRANPETGKVEGLAIDFMKEILKKAGLSYNFTMYPPARLFNNLKSGKTHIYLAPVTMADFYSVAIVSPKPLGTIHLCLYTVGGNPLPDSTAEIRDMTLIVVRNFTYGGLIDVLRKPANNITLDVSPDQKSVFNKLIYGRAKYALLYKSSVEELLPTMSPIPDLKYKELSSVDVYLCITRKMSNPQGLMDQIMKAYYELDAEGVLYF